MGWRDIFRGDRIVDEMAEYQREVRAENRRVAALPRDCGHCRFRDAHDGACHEGPPVQVAHQVDNQRPEIVQVFSEWPPVPNSGWCGRWKPEGARKTATSEEAT